MEQFKNELQQLKMNVLNMWELVYSQLEKSKEAFLTMNLDLAFSVLNLEKKVDAFELLIDGECERMIALYNPVAIDLRFILSSLKINTNLERIGDLAKGVSKILTQGSGIFDNVLINQSHVKEMFAEAQNMLALVKVAYEAEDSKLVRSVFTKDDLLDEINRNAIKNIGTPIHEHSEWIEQGLQLLSIIRKLERVGDHCSNIAEEIAFYLEANILKHSGKKEYMKNQKI